MNVSSVRETAAQVVSAAKEEREYLSYMAPGLLYALASNCPEARAWLHSNAPEEAAAVWSALSNARSLESLSLLALGAGGEA